jgi:hypothetical protein
MRLSLSGDYLCVLKEDYDQKALWMLSAKSGEVLWKSDPKDSRTPQPMHCMLIEGDKVYGIVPHAGQGFYVAGLECRTGQRLFKVEYKDYQGKPGVRLAGRVIGGQHLAAEVEDRQDFQVKVFDVKTGQAVHTAAQKGVGPFGVHGKVSATVQSGRVVLLSKDKLNN